MKIKILLVLTLALMAFTVSTLAQTVKITPKKTVYTRKFKVSFKEKRNFTVVYPVIGGAISPAARKTLENTISYWRIFETSLKENLTESDWLSDLYFQVNYNKNGILDISLTQEGSGAYPDSQTKNLVIDLKTGKEVKFADAFKSETAERLAALVDQKLAEEKRGLVEVIRSDKESFTDEEARQSTIEMVEALKFSADSFDEFSVSDQGVTFIFDAGFPHAIQALEPDGRYFFSWAQIKPSVRADGLLGRFVR